MGRRIGTTTVLVLLIAAAWSPTAPAGLYFAMTVSAGGLSAQGNPGSRCPHGAPGPPCVGERIDPTPRVRLPVRPRQTVVVTLDDPTVASRVIVTLGRPGRADRSRAVTLWTKRASAVGSDGHRWRVRLPRRLRDATYLGTSVSYIGAEPPAVNGSADFVTGVRSACAPN